MAGKIHENLNISKAIFREIDADDPNAESTVIESLCMNCGENGITRIFLTKIPYYKDIMLMSFECEHCNYQNNEIQSAGKIEEKGIKIKLSINSKSDINRQVVKSDYTSICIPHLDFEIPSQSQKGEITTVEGIINRAIVGLQHDQDCRKQIDTKAAEQIEQFINKLHDLMNVDEPFIILLEDISGNTTVQNPKAPQKDEECEVHLFRRTMQQNHILGIYSENEDTILQSINEDEYTLEEIEGEIITFKTNCPECNAVCETNMKMTKIPYFKEVVIMATVCEICGHKTNEVKSGSGIEPEGIKIQITVNAKEDFSRDLLKSETCHMNIPELDLEIGPATLGGRFTTVEGIIISIKDQLASSTTLIGDTADSNIVKKMNNFITQLDKILHENKKITLILDDPAGNSYVQSLSDIGCDDKLKITKYTRTFEQNEELGLNDMKVENY
ncbi:PREDICTED: zinc finger protein ZPR1 [Ceratosolen solmsi marchali]|uniref:Zinc finger protein ZPR1 n=1 Tax=Ceratosolen solmsi marchali TaxID=326594 RepID=A0AAJ6YSU0_9HYME|nr:PREDICTED: zinc finger protein ZPR1 [Ceratosolen solmsi marchali]